MTADGPDDPRAPDARRRAGHPPPRRRPRAGSGPPGAQPPPCRTPPGDPPARSRAGHPGRGRRRTRGTGRHAEAGASRHPVRRYRAHVGRDRRRASEVDRRGRSGPESRRAGRPSPRRTAPTSRPRKARRPEQAPSTLPEPGELPPGWEAALADALAFLRRRLTGDYDVDEFGFDPDFTDNVLLPPLRPLYRTWFRVETIGMENVPDEGGALVVANHSGTIPVDALMTSVALHDHHPAHRHLRHARRRPGVPDAVPRPDQPQGRQHAGLQPGRRAAAVGR